MDILTRTYKLMLWLTLYASGLHFFDNVYFFHQYPEPAWLTAPIVGALWIPLVLMAHRAADYIYAGDLYRSFKFSHAFVLANLMSLGHYLFGSPAEILPRINWIIGLQVVMAVALFGITLWMQARHSRESLRRIGKLWGVMAVQYGVVIVALEIFWPSTFDWWWL